jgi:ATP-binding cassette, subfamily B, bacterial
LAALRNVPPLLRMVWETSRAMTVVSLLLSQWFLGETRFAMLNYSMLYRYTPERRELDYLRFLGAGNESAKEVKISD